MKNELDSRFVLAVFEKIKEKGQPIENAYELDGLKAYTDLDGYTVYIEDAFVSLRFGFHNQYHFDYEKEEQFENFVKKLKAIDALE